MKLLIALGTSLAAVALAGGRTAQPPATDSDWVAQLHSINEKAWKTHAYGEVRFTEHAESLTIHVQMEGIPPDIVHWQHFHAFPDGRQSACPTIAADTSHDGLIDILETSTAAGTTMVPTLIRLVWTSPRTRIRTRETLAATPTRKPCHCQRCSVHSVESTPEDTLTCRVVWRWCTAFRNPSLCRRRFRHSARFHRASHCRSRGVHPRQPLSCLMQRGFILCKVKTQIVMHRLAEETRPGDTCDADVSDEPLRRLGVCRESE